MAKQKGKGWTILAVALTNSPVARQKDNPVSIVELDGVEYLRVPLIKKCTIRYLDQIIEFDQEKFDQMLKNHEERVWDAPPYVRIGHTSNPGLSWFAQLGDETPHGKMVQENDWLVGYALPTDDEVKKANRGYKFSSIDVHPDYSSNQMNLAFSSQEFRELEDIMDKKDEEDGITLSKAEYDALNAKGSAAGAAADADMAAIRDEMKLLKAANEKLELERVESRKQVYLSAVNAIIEKAKNRRSEDGKAALPAFVLNTASLMLRFAEINHDGSVITLDKSSGEPGLIDYMIRSVDHLLTNMPISMAVEGEATHEEGDDKSKEKISFGMGEKALDEFYSQEVATSFNVSLEEVQ